MKLSTLEDTLAKYEQAESHYEAIIAVCVCVCVEKFLYCYNNGVQSCACLSVMVLN